MVAMLSACSGETLEQTNDGFPAAADVLNDPDTIAETAKIDIAIEEMTSDGNWDAGLRQQVPL